MPKKEKHRTICSQHNWILVETASDGLTHFPNRRPRSPFTEDAQGAISKLVPGLLRVCKSGSVLHGSVAVLSEQLTGATR